MAKRPVKGHIALWLIGKSTDDPRVHDMLNTLGVYSAIRLIGPSAYHWGSAVGFVPRVAYAYWKQPKTGRGIRMLSKHGEYPIRYEYTKPVKTPVHSVGPAKAGTRAAAARGSGLLMAGFLLYSFRPSFQFLQGEEVVH